MFWNRLHSFVLISLVGGLSGFSWAALPPSNASSPPKGPVRIAVTNPNSQNRVHNAGKVWMNITNIGYFGNDSPGGPFDPLEDPCQAGVWAPQCEFPGGSGQQYLYQAGLWVGALIVEQGFETKRVSVGTNGWISDRIRGDEMFPGEGAQDGIQERSTRPGYYNCFGQMVYDPDAVSDQDFKSSYSDTLREAYWLEEDVVDGNHRPLGIKITQTSYSFSQSFAQDFILIDYEFENIASNYLKNLFVGLYVDSDVGSITEQPNWHNDDICGFVRYFYFERPDHTRDSVLIDVAYIADNDGRSYDNASGSNFQSPNVSGTRVVRGPNPRLETSFNWWISNGDVALDYGPSWEAYASRDSANMGWTREYGTPMGDERKYQVLSNGEFDFDQVYVDDEEFIRAHPQPWVTWWINPETGVPDTIDQYWEIPDATNARDLANGYDTRYLLSWGPLGIYEYTDYSGRRIYRLNPGEKFNMTIAYVCGENFHNVNHPQPNNEDIDPSLFDFADLRTNAYWAQIVYDNSMRDTYQWDWGKDHDPNTIDADGSQGDGILETGDGWYGEDVGTDGLYAELPAGWDSVEVWYWKGTRLTFAGWYKGPDADGTERNGKIDPVNNPYLAANSEDNIIPTDLYYSHPKYRFWDMGWMSGNNKLDAGDGLPDFTGPPPPPIPALLHRYPNTRNSAEIMGGMITASGATGGLGFEIQGNNIILRWSKKPSEDSTKIDPFSLVQDFEGYRIYVSNTNDSKDFSLLAEFDRIDWAYFAVENDSMATIPVTADTLLPSTTINGVPCISKPVGPNVGMEAIRVDDVHDDSTYQYIIADTRPLWPRYYSITAYDFGDPKSGLGPLETPTTANAVLLAPAGNPSKPVRVVPNPYRAYLDYTRPHSGGLSWENQNDGTIDFYPQVDRRIEFQNLPLQCLIRIFTVSGDLVAIIPHNVAGDGTPPVWVSDFSESWDLNSRNKQQVVSGLYLYSVEDKTSGNAGNMQTGKFVIIR